jgi:hypothetical protein
MKPCFLITAFCDTDVKMDSLRDTISKLKQYNIDIIVYSHSPIETDIHNSVNYLIYDKSNPVIWDMTFRSMIYWRKVVETPYKITSVMPDYGYAVIQQWKRGILFANDMGYDTVYIINYDTKFSNDFFNKVNTHLEDNTTFAIQYGESSMYLAFFAIKLNKDILDTISLIDFNHYIQSVGRYIVEGYLYQLLSKFISKLFQFDNFSEQDIGTDITIAIVDIYDDISCCSVTCGIEKFIFGDNHPNYDTLALLLFDISDDIKVDVYYDDANILSTFIKKELTYMYIHLPLLKSQINFDRLQFFINGIENNKLVDYAKRITIETLHQ